MTTVVEAIAIVEFSKKTHVEWANYLIKLRDTGCPDCIIQADVFAKTAGDVEHHEECIRNYDKVIAVLGGLPQ